MKVLLYTEGVNALKKSGLGKAITHQLKALEYVGVETTTDPDDTYDIAHINFYGPKSYVLAKKLKKKNIPIVYHAHSTEEDFRNSFILSNQIAPFFKKWLIKCYKLGDHIITPTLYSKKLLENYNLGKEITALSNGIELENFQHSKQLGIDFRKKYGFSSQDKVVMAIGLYLERKGILDFVELAKRMPDYKFIWFGYTPLYTVPKKVRTAVKNKLDNLQFPGYVPSIDIKGGLSGSDVYIFPTLEETEGIPIIEACACKCKAIVRDIGVFEGWLEDGVNVYKASNVDEFELKIRKICNGELPDLTKQAYKVAEERDLKNIGKLLKELYEKVINERKNNYEKN